MAVRLRVWVRAQRPHLVKPKLARVALILHHVEAQAAGLRARPDAVLAHDVLRTTGPRGRGAVRLRLTEEGGGAAA